MPVLAPRQSHSRVVPPVEQHAQNLEITASDSCFLGMLLIPADLERLEEASRVLESH